MNERKGQATILILLALGLFLLAAVGLAVDASMLYTQRQLAQSAADAAAQAGIMSIFNKTNTGADAFGDSAFTCVPGSDQRTPCVFAQYQRFGLTGIDTIDVDFPGSVPGVILSDDDTPAAIQVTVARTVDTTLMGLLGPTVSTVRAKAIAVITDIFSPVPIVVMHPTMSGAFAINGNPAVTICGGPSKSIQVNSDSTTSITVSGVASMVDLSRAGPKNWVSPASCNGSGADFGDFGGPPVYPGGYDWGADGEYVQPASRIQDPLKDVPDPPIPADDAPLPISIPGQTGGCPLPVGGSCVLYAPGKYPSGIEIKNELALFLPGLYYITSGGFQITANGQAHMAPCLVGVDPDFGCGMLVYNTGTNAAKDVFFISANAGQTSGVSYPYVFPGGVTCTGNCLLGSTDDGRYKGILFFQSRGLSYRLHDLHGGGGLTLWGTIYLTSTESVMRTTPGSYQHLSLEGTPGSTTRVVGMILADRLELSGNAGITMTLDPNAKLHIRQVALVR
jgi:hypothetical protein